MLDLCSGGIVFPCRPIPSSLIVSCNAKDGEIKTGYSTSSAVFLPKACNIFGPFIVELRMMMCYHERQCHSAFALGGLARSKRLPPFPSMCPPILSAHGLFSLRAVGFLWASVPHDIVAVGLSGIGEASARGSCSWRCFRDTYARLLGCRVPRSTNPRVRHLIQYRWGRSSRTLPKHLQVSVMQ